MASVIPSQVLGVDLHEASEEELSVEGVVRVDVGQFVLPLAPLAMHLFYPRSEKAPRPFLSRISMMWTKTRWHFSIQGDGGVEVAVDDLKLLDGFRGRRKGLHKNKYYQFR